MCLDLLVQDYVYEMQLYFCCLAIIVPLPSVLCYIPNIQTYILLKEIINVTKD